MFHQILIDEGLDESLAHVFGHALCVSHPRRADPSGEACARVFHDARQELDAYRFQPCLDEPLPVLVGRVETVALNLALSAKLFRQMGLPELAPARAA